MRELRRQIEGIFNAGQDEYELREGVSLDGSEPFVIELYRRFEIGTNKAGIRLVQVIDSDLAMIGFLVNRDYGFAEAWKDYHGILAYETRQVLVDGIDASNVRERVNASCVEWFLLNLGIAKDKDEWLRANL